MDQAPVTATEGVLRAQLDELAADLREARRQLDRAQEAIAAWEVRCTDLVLEAERAKAKLKAALEAAG